MNEPNEAESRRCACGHSETMHSGGLCVILGCECEQFTERGKQAV